MESNFPRDGVVILAETWVNDITSVLVLRRKVDTLYGYVFFFYSFGYLLSRACLMCFCAAFMNEASQKPNAVLYTVPSGSYNMEV